MAICHRKIAGRWMVRHEHVSMPFDVESCKASLDPKPQYDKGVIHVALRRTEIMKIDVEQDAILFHIFYGGRR